jgi:hypothetical protein
MGIMGRPMIRILIAGIGFLALSGLIAPSVAGATDLGVVVRHSRHATQVQSRPMGCPDGYGCYPLYGAYGPYGGTPYWTSFSYRY